MATVPRSIPAARMTPSFPSEWSLADIQQLLGDIPLNRIAIQPPLGSATEFDVERRHSSEGKLLELEYGMVWYIDPTTRSAISYSSPSDADRVLPTECITGGEVLPGFSIQLQALFDKADQQAARTKK